MISKNSSEPWIALFRLLEGFLTFLQKQENTGYRDRSHGKSFLNLIFTIAVLQFLNIVHSFYILQTEWDKHNLFPRWSSQLSSASISSFFFLKQSDFSKPRNFMNSGPSHELGPDENASVTQVSFLSGFIYSFQS